MTSIGAHNFVNIDRRPAGPQEGVVLESQAGVDGVTAWLTGNTGRRSTIMSFRDCVDLADALTTFAAYEAAAALGPLAVYYGQTLLPFGVKVLDVQAVEIKSVVHGSGGVLGTSGAILRARWSLVSWKVP